MQTMPPANSMVQSPPQQQMPVSQNQQMQAAYNQQMGYQAPIQSAPVTPVTHSVQPIWKIKMADKGLFFTKIGALLLTILTLGIGKPWAETMVINKWTRNLSIDGRSVRYNGSASGLFGIWIKILLLSVITLGIYYLFWGRYAVDKYVDSHLSWA
ncbi:MAG: DUF898 family protein [Candidatus Thalassarchaeaceae archaeon]|nr:DUF898 family protein [Candidatus Thalassarchaeaceae archaeon]